MINHIRFSALATLLAVFAACCAPSVGQVPFPQHCPDVKIMQEFDLDAYMGIWYEHSKYPFIFEIGKRCMYALYTNNSNGTVAVMNAAINVFTGQPSNVTGTATVIAPAQLAVSFSPNQEVTQPNYLVLGTDYTSYAVVYSCRNVTSIAHTKIIWILTRDRKPADATIETARKIIDDNSLSQTFFINTNQKDCPQLEYDKAAAAATTTAADEPVHTTSGSNTIDVV